MAWHLVLSDLFIFNIWITKLGVGDWDSRIEVPGSARQDVHGVAHALDNMRRPKAQNRTRLLLVFPLGVVHFELAPIHIAWGLDVKDARLVGHPNIPMIPQFERPPALHEHKHDQIAQHLADDKGRAMRDEMYAV